MEKKKVKRLINCLIPIYSCNFKCHYCYIPQLDKETGVKNGQLKYSPEIIGKALSVERLQGYCLFNFCGFGETLLLKDISSLIYHIAKQGHFIEIVTNGTLNDKFDEILSLPDFVLKQLEFKFSFHYLELVRLNKLQDFIRNVNKVKEQGCSFTIELMPNDEVMEYIEDIKKLCTENFGALCHLTVGRNQGKKGYPILTELDKKEYISKWGEFKSQLFDFKLSTFGVKRKEYCYAGDWSMVVDFGRGVAKQCYSTSYEYDIFKNISNPIPFVSVGCHCPEPHCFNSHAYLTLGDIPTMDTPTYADVRNREIEGERDWLNNDCKMFLNSKFSDTNKEYSLIKKITNEIENYYQEIKYRTIHFVRSRKRR